MIEEIKLTEEVERSSSAEEIMRVWLTDDNQTVLLRGSVWSDPAAWGILLSDVMRHLANIYAAEGSQSFDSAFARIRSGLQAELDHLS